MNEHLADRVFLVSPHITAADVFAVTHLSPFLRECSNKDKLEKPHLLRWINHLQNLPSLGTLLEVANLTVKMPDINAPEYSFY